ncbi:hypothetical protein Q8A73_021764 [Channa argus]|nr:hypothetical protein Q8A73_021764 [Channa argus]
MCQNVWRAPISGNRAHLTKQPQFALGTAEEDIGCAERVTMRDPDPENKRNEAQHVVRVGTHGARTWHSARARSARLLGTLPVCVLVVLRGQRQRTQSAARQAPIPASRSVSVGSFGQIKSRPASVFVR